MDRIPIPESRYEPGRVETIEQVINLSMEGRSLIDIRHCQNKPKPCAFLVNMTALCLHRYLKVNELYVYKKPPRPVAKWHKGDKDAPAEVPTETEEKKP